VAACLPHAVFSPVLFRSTADTFCLPGSFAEKMAFSAQSDYARSIRNR
jgi:hypothetical protein